MKVPREVEVKEGVAEAQALHTLPALPVPVEVGEALPPITALLRVGLGDGVFLPKGRVALGMGDVPSVAVPAALLVGEEEEVEQVVAEALPPLGVEVEDREGRCAVKEGEVEEEGEGDREGVPLLEPLALDTPTPVLPEGLPLLLFVEAPEHDTVSVGTEEKEGDMDDHSPSMAVGSGEGVDPGGGEKVVPPPITKGVKETEMEGVADPPPPSPWAPPAPAEAEAKEDGEAV